MMPNRIINRKISIAPMLDWSDRHYRFFVRLLSKEVLVYTEMITTGAILHNDLKRFLYFHPVEHPIALQLGGSVPKELMECSKIAEQFGYDEINLNVGCPSGRVQSGRFGACLMAYPGLVADCIAAMNSVVSIPVTVKTRIGIDDRDSYEDLTNFVKTVASAGCKIFIIHARKAWLKGLNPKENREIPPLQYEVVQQLKKDFPALQIIVNGGIKSLTAITEHLTYADGVMIGRQAYYHPYFIAQIEQAFFTGKLIPSKHEVIKSFLPYIEAALNSGVNLQSITKSILGFYSGEPGARAWRRYLSEHTYKKGAGVNIIEEALKLLR
ncbi:MAG: tRNA dihydrouridine(20/20a) synthase DusA [Gammaproteobacteria bacterium RIFCSPHIGHO2_12_FULL_35_23]|nr:MAG: tRNA dihydrouridine(20/20a) synthase DusA [Gammaproteobacteria bacterium RIFCSPHIGHO2_12_FULL_35_23]